MPLNAGNFITRWQQSSAAERANYALFLSELCDYLDLPRPNPTQADEDTNSYVIDKAVYFQNLDGSSTTNYIDLYKRNCFVLEAKQGSNPQSNAAAPLASPKEPRRMKRGTAVRGTHGWDEAMLAARGQAERYAKALPVSEGWPPFLVVVDVGHSIELYADFSLTGKAYLPFPDPRTFRILNEQLDQAEIKERLRAVWLDPLSLDPSRETAKVTREVAGKLAVLARNLELHHPPKQVAEFLTRCIFTSFAEDVNLLPERSWLNLLESLRDDVGNFPPMAEALWQTMNDGGFSPILRAHILKFNGGLFESTKALPLTRDQLGLLIEAADSRWRDVEPAIFGTLLERALDPDERHALGAHYTPRAYVERLVIPTIVEPLRDDWRSSQAVITEQVNAGTREAAIETARAFHRQLCSTRVLDPACGSGNFLYVSLEHMKRLEGEVLETLHALGDTQQSLEHTGLTVDPHQLLGLELNPRAAVVADLVLWIGYLQWHFRTRGDAQPPIPVISNFHNIAEADAILTWRSRTPALDSNGNIVTQWDGVTTKESPVTGQQIPDETARRTVYQYSDVKKMKWPEADFIVGNPSMSFDLLIPFLRPIEPLLLDDGVSEIMGNPNATWYAEREGQMLPQPAITFDAGSLRTGLEVIANNLGKRLDEDNPVLEAQLPDGSRICAYIPPAVKPRPGLTIRKFTGRHFAAADLIAHGTLSRSLAEFLADQIKSGKTLLISGGTGTGKTTLLNVLAQAIPDDERIVTIEDTAELRIPKPNLVSFECQTDTFKEPLSFEKLLRTALRCRPDRIIVGEVRGTEARTLLDSLNTGHSGSLATIHANSAAKALSRFANLVLRGNQQMSYADIEAEIGEAVDYVVHVEREPSGRVVREVLRIIGYDRRTQRFEMDYVFPSERRTSPEAIHAESVV